MRLAMGEINGQCHRNLPHKDWYKEMERPHKYGLQLAQPS